MTRSNRLLIPATLATLLSLVQHPAYSGLVSSQNPRPSAVSPEISSRSYHLLLSLTENTNGWSPNTPYMTLSLVNLTHNTLFFSWAPNTDLNLAVFEVQFKELAANPKLNEGWQRVAPNSRPIPGNVDREAPFVEVNAKQGVPILPEKIGKLSFPLDFPMSKNGLYRISAILTVPEASEYNGAVSPVTKVRSFELVVPSKPLVVLRTATRFVEVPDATDKQTPIK